MRRSNLIFYILIGLLPFSLTACGKKETAVQQNLPPLIKVGTVEYSSRASRSFTGVVAARVQK
jgi:predicted small lipoprotein YifL